MTGIDKEDFGNCPFQNTEKCHFSTHWVALLPDNFWIK